MADDGIHYDWSIDAKMAGVDEGIKTIESAIGSTEKLHKATQAAAGATHEHGAMAYKAGEAWHRHKYEMEGVGQTVREVKGKFMEFGEAIGAVLAFEIAKEGIEKIRELGSEIVHAAAGAERMGLALKLTVGEEGGKEVLEWIEKIASKTEFTDQQLKGWAANLLNAGVKMKDIDKFMAAGMDVAAKGGDIGTAMEALARAQLTGKIEGRALRGLHIGTEQIKTLPEFAGLTDKQVNKKLETTPITKDQLFALIAGPDKVLGDLAVQAGQTMGAKVKNLSTLFEQYFEKLAGSPVFETFKEKLGTMFEALDPNGPRGAMIFKSLEEAVGLIVTKIGEIDFDKVAKTITDDVIPALKTMVGLIGPTLAAINQMVDGMKIAVKAFSGGGGEEKMKKQMEEQKGDGWFKRQWKHLTEGGGDEMTKTLVALHAAQAEELGASAPAGYIKGVKDNQGDVNATMTDFAGSAVATAAEEMGTHSPSKRFEELGLYAGDGFIDGIEKSRRGIDDVVQGAFAVPALKGRGLGAGGGGGITVTIPVTVSSHPGQSPEEVGRAIGEQVRAVVLPMLIDVFEQAGAEAGA